LIVFPSEAKFDSSTALALLAWGKYSGDRRCRNIIIE
jgi:hypothetical protein